MLHSSLLLAAASLQVVGGVSLPDSGLLKRVVIPWKESNVTHSVTGSVVIVTDVVTETTTECSSTSSTASGTAYSQISTYQNPVFNGTSSSSAPATSASASVSSSVATASATVALSSPAATDSASSSLTTSALATTVSAASSVSSSLPNGGILSIPPSSASPIASLLASRADCQALMDNQLPSKNSIPSNFTFSGNVRTYYVAAEQIAWNYAPDGWDNWLGVPLKQSPRAYAAGYLNATGSIGGDGGTTWQKAVYRGYTDETFSTPSERADTEGINGPILRAEVDDMIQILFVNNLPNHYASMHAMGLYYGKQYEGSLYPNTTTGESPPVQEQDAVPPGGCAVYKWIVSDSQAPSPGQSSRLWSYHSYVNMPADISAGLVGPVIVYDKGQMADTMASNREFVLNYISMFEAQSFLAGTNAAQYGNLTHLPGVNYLPGGPAPVGNETFWQPQLTNMPSVSLGFRQAPVFHTLNGLVFANGAPYKMCRNDPTLWYIMGWGEASHVFHMHGNNFKYLDQWQAAMSVNIGEMFTLTMNAQLPGVWQLICHVSTHDAFGMQQNYVVYETEDGETCPLPPLTAKLNGSP